MSQALVVVRAALSERGFGVLTEIDVQKTLKEKLYIAFRPYVILGGCNPSLTHQASQADLGIGLLLPSGDTVYYNLDQTSGVEVIDPVAALGIVGDQPAVGVAARVAALRLRRVIAILEASA